MMLGVIDRLGIAGATVVVIEHDLDVIANADYVIDMGPGSGSAGGRIIAIGTPEAVAGTCESVTGAYLRTIPGPVWGGDARARLALNAWLRCYLLPS